MIQNTWKLLSLCFNTLLLIHMTTQEMAEEVTGYKKHHNDPTLLLNFMVQSWFWSQIYGLYMYT